MPKMAGNKGRTLKKPSRLSTDKMQEQAEFKPFRRMFGMIKAGFSTSKKAVNEKKSLSSAPDLSQGPTSSGSDEDTVVTKGGIVHSVGNAALLMGMTLSAIASAPIFHSSDVASTSSVEDPCGRSSIAQAGTTVQSTSTATVESSEPQALESRLMARASPLVRSQVSSALRAASPAPPSTRLSFKMLPATGHHFTSLKPSTAPTYMHQNTPSTSQALVPYITPSVRKTTTPQFVAVPPVLSSSSTTIDFLSLLDHFRTTSLASISFLNASIAHSQMGPSHTDMRSTSASNALIPLAPVQSWRGLVHHANKWYESKRIQSGAATNRGTAHEEIENTPSEEQALIANKHETESLPTSTCMPGTSNSKSTKLEAKSLCGIAPSNPNPHSRTASTATTLNEPEPGSSNEDDDSESAKDPDWYSAQEVDFLLANAETDRVNDLAAQEDEYRDQLRYLEEDKEALAKENARLVRARNRCVKAAAGKVALQDRVRELRLERERLEKSQMTKNHESEAEKDNLRRKVGALEEVLKDTSSTANMQKLELERTVGELRRQLGEQAATNLHLTQQLRSGAVSQQGFGQRAINGEPSTAEWQGWYGQLYAQTSALVAELNQANAAKTALEDNVGALTAEVAELTMDLTRHKGLVHHQSKKLDEADRALEMSQRLRKEAGERQTELQARLLAVTKQQQDEARQAAEDLADCTVQLQNTIAIAVRLEADVEVDRKNYQQNVQMLKAKVTNDDLCLNLADTLETYIDRNKSLEMELADNHARLVKAEQKATVAERLSLSEVRGKRAIQKELEDCHAEQTVLEEKVHEIEIEAVAGEKEKASLRSTNQNFEIAIKNLEAFYIEFVAKNRPVDAGNCILHDLQNEIEFYKKEWTVVKDQCTEWQFKYYAQVQEHNLARVSDIRLLGLAEQFYQERNQAIDRNLAYKKRFATELFANPLDFQWQIYPSFEDVAGPEFVARRDQYWVGIRAPQKLTETKVEHTHRKDYNRILAIYGAAPANMQIPDVPQPTTAPDAAPGPSNAVPVDVDDEDLIPAEYQPKKGQMTSAELLHKQDGFPPRGSKVPCGHDKCAEGRCNRQEPAVPGDVSILPDGRRVREV